MLVCGQEAHQSFGFKAKLPLLSPDFKSHLTYDTTESSFIAFRQHLEASETENKHSHKTCTPTHDKSFYTQGHTHRDQRHPHGVDGKCGGQTRFPKMFLSVSE